MTDPKLEYPPLHIKLILLLSLMASAAAIWSSESKQRARDSCYETLIEKDGEPTSTWHCPESP